MDHYSFKSWKFVWPDVAMNDYYIHLLHLNPQVTFRNFLVLIFLTTNVYGMLLHKMNALPQVASFLYSPYSKSKKKVPNWWWYFIFEYAFFQVVAFRLSYPTKNWGSCWTTAAIIKYYRDYLLTSVRRTRLHHHSPISEVFSQVGHLIRRCWVNHASTINFFSIYPLWDPPAMFIEI